MQKNSNYQDVLKVIAITAMIIDHLGLYFFPESMYMRVVGRYAMPIFCFFAGYNFKGNIRYTILIYGLVLYAISTLLIFHQFVAANILISIFLGQIYLRLFQKQLANPVPSYIHSGIMACLWYFTSHLFDYGTLVISIMILGLMIKQHPEKTIFIGGIISFVSFATGCFVFFGLFDARQILMSIIIALFVFLSFILLEFDEKVELNARKISRNSLLIYSVHFAAIELIWRYCF